MRIDSASIGMDSARSYHASKTSVRRFEITDYQAGLTDVSTKGQKTPNGEDTTQNTEEQENTAENTTMTAKDWQSRLLVSSARWDMRSSASEQTLSTIREYTVRYIFDLLFPSRNSTLRDWMQENGWSSGNQTGNSWNTGNSVNNTQTNSGSTQGTATPASDVFNLVTSRVKILNYVSETWNIEQEDTSFSTVGSVRTKDGREINFNVNVNMSRRCEEYYKEQLNVAEFTLHDPLVINLDTDVAEVSDQTFYFDLDADGKEEEISVLNGSGYLALDKNGDGTINDGSELFGTRNGDGFTDLAQYDEDGNGWIDENDSIWSKLKIWCKDENGNDVLYKLSDKGVGAICLQNVSTDLPCRETVRLRTALPMPMRPMLWSARPVFSYTKTEMWVRYSTWIWLPMPHRHRINITIQLLRPINSIKCSYECKHSTLFTWL